MRSLTIRLYLDDDVIHPMHAFIAGDDRYGPTRLLQWNPTEEGTNLMLFHIAGPREPYTAALDETETIASYDVAPSSSSRNQFTLIVEETITDSARGIVAAYANENVITVPPVVFHADRSVEMTLVGSNSALERMMDHLPERMAAEVERLKTGGPPVEPPSEQLTNRQRRVLTTALKTGYYDQPRGATLEDVAARLDLAVGTVAEHVRKAEARLVRDALGEPTSNHSD